MATEVKVPTLGESVTEATVGQWLKKPGEAVKADEPIVSLETDKVAVDVPAPAAGTMGDIVAKEGDTVEVGALLAYVNEGAAAASSPAPAPAAKAEAATPAPSASTPAPAPAAADEDGEGGNLTLSPAVRRLVLEHGLDPSKIKGSGKDGRLTKDDVMAAVDAGTAKAASTGAEAAPAEAAPAAGPSRKQERVKMTRLRQTVAKRLKEAQNNAALLTTFNDVDMTNVIEARTKYKDLFEKKHGVRLGFMGFFTKAVCMALKDIPGVNGQIEGDEIVYNDFADISVAVSAPTGLVVPVIRNAESMSVAQIERTIGDFGKKAKEGKLTMEDMKGGTFTISNGGVFGSLMSTPIINPPQSAVLGLHRIEDRPVVRDGQVVVRPMMYLALSYDHRLIDGREAVTFLVAVKNAIEDPTRLLIDL
ncbi:2-oxoglutarate dehydrogenase complex dihydrolipoyllysine-residue succinyltransferase [Sphingobium lactosutens]|jgi:2-oxoglutarate dehydrogenase E2 component (dihydrolipoamide succinyltransferase)|uniref:2-oxoglutarate dehydrogenase complex dihydrolipoyllysine-residue succinyltransferase n=1 Tax=Sphingobium lactosutens TaxID=522773 RepID=UPI000C6616BD|nr:2-oxoglutarate dehydrogenase complex dihydrolipoyllysine-residue succinyltransferase [Sphingobium lactosutens]MAX14453.1 dihydrolipoyllysine-residue succinyltransferase [Sphingobium sp.]MBA37757.1 dihydrolipoyllysine-residue succinyltransferase [Sphingobium sp.]MBS47832.1 dihydrolipoyllysine-residue succinyltransferase [Sphingobium sp.]MCC4255697.1 2-oxoglutarate dehydrogenase complex dihydrolipoyllysine-residue succinyltransferase [Sphingobium lactosutens]|tara:strand:+ start:3244 stop:4500 length:1257 start_codon:yes stop_codon:yes gene_type:complete